MTNKEAIERLQRCKRNLELGKVIGVVTEEGADERIEAYELAIKALKDRQQGEWLDNDREDTYRRCSICNELVEKDNYCGNCGADMRKGEQE